MKFKFFACAAGMLVLAGCAQTRPAAPSAAPIANDTRGDVQIQLTISPDPPRQLDTATFTVVANDKHGKPFRDATVKVGLIMPSMEMPKNEVVCQQTKPGVYVGTGRITMSGDWEARVMAVSGKESGGRSFPITVK